MQERRVRTRQGKPAPGRPQVNIGQEVAGLLLAAAGVWFFLALGGKGGGILGEFLGQGLRTVAGGAGAWVAALFFLWFGFYLISLRFRKEPFVWGRRAWSLMLLLLSFEVVLQLAAYHTYPGGGDWENAWLGFGGGIIGWGLTVPLTAIFGFAGRYVVLLVAILIGLVLNTEMTFGGVVHWFSERLSDGARSARGAAGEFYQMVTASPKESKSDPGPEETVRRERKQAATEDLNTIGPREKPAPAPEPPVIRLNTESEHKPTGTEPVAQPHPPEAKPAERPSRAPAERTRRHDEGEEIHSVALGGDRPSGTGADYRLPTFEMLAKPVAKTGTSRHDHLERASLLERTLKTFGVEAKVVEISPGPAVTRYELQPGEGVRVNKFTALADDLALALAAEDVRIEAPIPGKAAVGIEVPNKERQAVPLREVMETPSFQNGSSKLTVAFGKDNAGNPVIGDLAKMPHLLIAGSTGSGKSVCMNTIISSVLFKAKPDEVKMLMIDPKMVELSTYNGIPHLMAPVITDVKKAAGFLKGAVKEMENRYELFAAAGARNIQQYNQMCLSDPGPDPEHPRKPLPLIVIFIDELADLMMVAPVDVEDSICRLAQMARACGMHLVIATQSPRVDVITGLIKANIPSRIAFAVSSQVDSRVIMDYAGAERLLGRGDMLYHPTGLSKPTRAQGAFIDEKEVENLVTFVKAQGRPVYTAEEVAVEVGAGKSRPGASGGAEGEPSSAAETIFPQAVRIVIEHGQASVSILQRRLRCNYNKAARLIDMMEERGFIGPHQGSKPREVLLTLPQWHEMFGDSDVASAGEELGEE